ITVRRGRRIVVFDPVVRGTEIVGYLAAELEPSTIYRHVISDPEVADSVVSAAAPVYHSVLGPNRAFINQQSFPPGWPTVTRDIPVADTKWQVVMAYAPVEVAQFRRERATRWAIGIAFALVLATVLWLLR